MTKYIILFLLLASFKLSAQHVIKGQILDSITNKTIKSASITNLTRKFSTVSDTAGSFSIRASFGDSIMVHALSYINDTLVVSKDNYIIALQPSAHLLEEVNIKHLNLPPIELPPSPFHGQSMVYKYHYGGEEIGGVVFRVWYWKKDEKKRAKELNLEREYKAQSEIKEIFSERNLAGYLPLRGDSLKLFIKLYTPTPKEYLAPDFDFLLYVNHSYKKFKQQANRED